MKNKININWLNNVTVLSIQKSNVFRFVTYEVQVNNRQDFSIIVLLKMTILKQMPGTSHFYVLLVCNLASQSRNKIQSFTFNFKSTKISLPLLEIALKADLLSKGHESY